MIRKVHQIEVMMGNVNSVEEFTNLHMTRMLQMQEKKSSGKLLLHKKG